MEKEKVFLEPRAVLSLLATHLQQVRARGRGHGTQGEGARQARRGGEGQGGQERAVSFGAAAATKPPQPLRASS